MSTRGIQKSRMHDTRAIASIRVCQTIRSWLAVVGD
jgi:hypothetical protein